MSVEGDIRVSTHVLVEGERRGHVLASLDPCGNGLGLVAELGLESAETTTGGDDGTGLNAGNDFVGNVCSAPGELGGGNRGDVGAACGVVSGENSSVGLVEGVGGDGVSVGGLGLQLGAGAGRVEVGELFVILIDGDGALSVGGGPGVQGVLQVVVLEHSVAAVGGDTHGEEALGSVGVEGESNLSALGGGVVASANGAILGVVNGAVSAGTGKGRSTIITVGNEDGKTVGSQNLEFSVGSGDVLLRVVSEGRACGSDVALVSLGPSVADRVDQGGVGHLGELLSPVQNPLTVSVGQKEGVDSQSHSSGVLDIEIRLHLVATISSVQAVRANGGDVNSGDVEVLVEGFEGTSGEVIGEGSNGLEILGVGSLEGGGYFVVGFEDLRGDELIGLGGGVGSGCDAGVIDKLGNSGNEIDVSGQLGGDVGRTSDPDTLALGDGGDVVGELSGEEFGGKSNSGFDLDVVGVYSHLGSGDAHCVQPLRNSASSGGVSGNEGSDGSHGGEFAVVGVLGVADFPEDGIKFV